MTEKRIRRARLIEAWWAQEVSREEIARRLGWPVNALAWELAYLRKHGFDLPARRPGRRPGARPNVTPRSKPERPRAAGDPTRIRPELAAAIEERVAERAPMETVKA